MTNEELFKKQGYIYCPQFFSEQEITALEEGLREATPRFPTTLNKSGLVFSEFLHFHSKFLQAFISSEKMVGFLKPFIGNNFFLRKDQTVTKYHGGQEFPWHQDNGYNKLKEPYYQIWIAITEMIPENGGLRLLPGTHLNGILPHAPVGNHLTWQGNAENEVVIRASRGDVLFFSSMLLHRSGPNLTDKTRIAYVLEFMPTENFDPFVIPPYFQVAKNGKPAPKFIHFYKGNLSLRNQLRYLRPRIKQKSWEWTLALRNLKKRLLGKP